MSCAKSLGVMSELNRGRLLISNIVIFAPSRSFKPHGDIFYHEVIKGVSEAVAPHDVYLHYCALEEEQSDIAVFLQRMNDAKTQAAIIIGIDDPTIHKLAASLGKPCVLVNSEDKTMALDCVSPDHRGTGLRAGNYLYEQGQRRILVLTSLRRDTLIARLRGIKSALERHHLPFTDAENLLVTEGFGEEESQNVVADYFSRYPFSKPPGLQQSCVILCGGHGMALGAFKALQTLGLRVPQDVSLMSTDFDYPRHDSFIKSLTTLQVPCKALGIEAVHLLQNRLSRPDAPSFNLMLQGKLEVRESVRKIAYQPTSL